MGDSNNNNYAGAGGWMVAVEWFFILVFPFIPHSLDPFFPHQHQRRRTGNDNADDRMIVMTTVMVRKLLID